LDISSFNIGDSVRIKDRSDWPSPPGYVLANAEGKVTRWTEYDEVMNGFSQYVCVQIEKAQAKGEIYIGNKFFFRIKMLEKI